MGMGRVMRSATRYQRMAPTLPNTRRIPFFVHPTTGAAAAPLTQTCAFGTDGGICTLPRGIMPCASRRLAAHGRLWIPALVKRRGRSWRINPCSLLNCPGRVNASTRPRSSRTAAACICFMEDRTTARLSRSAALFPQTASFSGASPRFPFSPAACPAHGTAANPAIRMRSAMTMAAFICSTKAARTAEKPGIFRM